MGTASCRSGKVCGAAAGNRSATIKAKCSLAKRAGEHSWGLISAREERFPVAARHALPERQDVVPAQNCPTPTHAALESTRFHCFEMSSRE